MLISSVLYALQAIPFRSAPPFLFKSAAFGAIVAYAIVLYKTYSPNLTSRASWNKHFFARLMLDDNVQYFILALSMLIDRPILFSLAPYAIYATFHISTYLRSVLLPAIYPNISDAKTASYASRVSNLLNQYTRSQFQPAMQLVASLETFLLFRLFFGVFLRKNSISRLVGYIFFLRMRYTNSHFTRASIKAVSLRMDRLVADNRVPPVIKNAWHTFKTYVSKFGASPVGTAQSRPTASSSTTAPSST